MKPNPNPFVTAVRNPNGSVTLSIGDHKKIQPVTCGNHSVDVQAFYLLKKYTLQICSDLFYQQYEKYTHWKDCPSSIRMLMNDYKIKFKTYEEPARAARIKKHFFQIIEKHIITIIDSVKPKKESKFYENYIIKLNHVKNIIQHYKENTTLDYKTQATQTQLFG